MKLPTVSLCEISGVQERFTFIQAKGKDKEGIHGHGRSLYLKLEIS